MPWGLGAQNPKEVKRDATLKSLGRDGMDTSCLTFQNRNPETKERNKYAPEQAGYSKDTSYLANPRIQIPNEGSETVGQLLGWVLEFLNG